MTPLSSQALADTAAQASQWRQELHAIPELLYDLPKTAAYIAQKLRDFGCNEVVEHIGDIGVVGRIRGNNGPGRSIGLRSDMDALPITEETNLPYRSTHPGHMHACGHDGHMAMLLGAAKALCLSRDFSGEVVVIFQPAEEGGGGGLRMIEDGLFDRFPVDEVYGMHNFPGLAIGQFASRPGAMLGADDGFHITFIGDGCHAAMPHAGVDPVVGVAALATSLQSIVSRCTNPFDPAVVSVTYILTGARNAINVVPGTAELGGTVRTLNPATRKSIEQRMREMTNSMAIAHGLTAKFDWQPGYPVSINDTQCFKHAQRAARSIAETENFDGDCAPALGSEDFAYMLERKPGAMIWIGNGPSAKLHHPAYDFNNDAIPHGIAYWIALAQSRCRAA